MSAYPHAKFLVSANDLRQLPTDVGVEVAVAGRSNAGKSSAINAIVQRNGLARTSKTPGATRLINFFEIAPRQRLVDLPGYGFASVPGAMREHWGTLIEGYFRRRRSLCGVMVVLDARHPLKPHDVEMLELAQSRAVPVHLLLTKADKLSRSAGVAACAAIRRAIGEDATVQLFSAHAGTGVLEARAALERLLAATPEKETPAEPADPAGAGKPGVGG